MIDLNDGFIQKPDDGLGYSRAFVCAIGRLEELERGQQVRAWYSGAYVYGHILRPIPGGCYWMQISHGHCKAKKMIVTCGNFGGVVA